MDTMTTSRETNDEMANSDSPNNVYIKFLGFCSQALSREDPKFLELIKAKYETCDHEFRSSERMVNLLIETQENMEKDPSRIFVHLKDFITELKAFGFQKNVRKRKKEKIQPSCLEASVDGMGRAQKIPKHLNCSLSLEKTAISFDRTREPSCFIGHGNFDSSEEIGQLKQSNPDQNCLNSQASLGDGEPSCEDISLKNNLKVRTTCTNSLNAGRHGNEQNCMKNGSSQKKLTSILNIGFSHSKNIKKIVPFAMEDPSCNVKDKVKYCLVELTKFDENDLSSSKDSNFFEYSKQTTQIDTEPICETLNNTQRMIPNEDGCQLEKSLNTNTLHDDVLKIAEVGDGPAEAQLPEVMLTPLKTSDDALTPHDGVLRHVCSVGTEHPKTGLHTNDKDCVVGATINKAVNSSPERTITSDKEQSEKSFVHVEHCAHKKDGTEEILRKPSTHDKLNADKTKEPKRGNLTSVPPNPENTETQSKVSMKPGPSWKADVEEGASADEFQESNQDDELKAKPNGRHVCKLENLLKLLHNEIEKCQKRELSLDDLEDETSPYIYEDKLKKKFVAAWKKLCEITNRSVSTGRPTERTIKFSGTRFKEINRRLERFLNKKKVFPDFFDVKNIVSLTNKKYKMKLSPMMINDISREAFVDIGEMLQTRRHQDFIATFGNRQTDTLRAGIEPYMTDPELKRKLDNNRKLAKNNLDEVIAKYTRLQNERHDDEDDSDEEEENEINEVDGKHTDNEDKNSSPHTGKRKAVEIDESESDDDASEVLAGKLSQDSTSVASDSPSKRSSDQHRISLKKTKPKYNPLQQQLCENPYLSGSDMGCKLNSLLPEDAQIDHFAKALGLNPTVHSCDTSRRTSHGNVIVIDESPTPSKLDRRFLLKSLGSSSDTDGRFDDASNLEANLEPNSENDKLALLKKPNIKFTARKTLPPESHPFKKYADNEDDDVMISYEEIAKENLEDSEDQSSDAGSENNDPGLDDEDEDIMIIDSSESEIGSESSRGGSPVSIISLGSSLDDGDENDIDLVNKMFKIKKEVESPQKLTIASKELHGVKRKLMDQSKLYCFEELSSKYGQSREAHRNTNTYISQVLDLANSSRVPGANNENGPLRKPSRRNGTEFLDLASCEVVSAVEKPGKVHLNRVASSWMKTNGEVQSKIIPDLDNCIVIRDASDESLGEKCGQAHQGSILSDQGVQGVTAENNSKAETEISKEISAGQESFDSILITDVVSSQVGDKEILDTANCVSKEVAPSEDVMTGDNERRGGKAGVNPAVCFEALDECTENLEVAIEVDESLIGASEMGLPVAAENDTYLLHQDKGKNFQGLVNSTSLRFGPKGQKEVDFIMKQDLPQGHTDRSNAFASPGTEDVSVIVIDENSQDMSISLGGNQSKMSTNTFPNKSRQNLQNNEKHYQSFVPTTSASFKKQRYPEVIHRLDHTEKSWLNTVSAFNSVGKYSVFSDNLGEQRDRLKARETGLSGKGKDLKRSDSVPIIEIDCSDDEIDCPDDGIDCSDYEEAQPKTSTGNTICDNEGGFIRDVEVHTKSKPGLESLADKELLVPQELDSVSTTKKDSASAVKEITCPSTATGKTKTSQPCQGLACIQEEESSHTQSQEVLNVSSLLLEIPSQEGAGAGQNKSPSHLDDPPKTPDCIHNLRESVLLPNMDVVIKTEVSPSQQDLTKGHGEQDDQEGIALTLSAVVSLSGDVIVSESNPTDKISDIKKCPADGSQDGNVEEEKLKFSGTESVSSAQVDGSKQNGLTDSDTAKPNTFDEHVSDTEDVVLVVETAEKGDKATNVNSGEDVNLHKLSEKEVQGETINTVNSVLPNTDVTEAKGSFSYLDAQPENVSSKTGDQKDKMASLDIEENIPISDDKTLEQTKSDEVASSEAETYDQDNEDIEEDEDAFKSIFRICDKMLRNDKPAVDEKQLSSESAFPVPDSDTENISHKLDTLSNSSINNFDAAPVLEINLDDQVAVVETPVKTLNEDKEKELDKRISQELKGAEGIQVEVNSSVAANSNITKEDMLKDGEDDRNLLCHVIPVEGVTTEVASSVEEDDVNETDKQGKQKRKRSASTDNGEAEIEIIEELSSAKGKRLCARSKEDDRKLVDQLLENMVLQTTQSSPIVLSVESISEMPSKTDGKTSASSKPQNSKKTEENGANIEDEVPMLDLECDIVEDVLSPSATTSTVENSITEVSIMSSLAVVINRNKKKRQHDSSDSLADPDGGQDENNTRDKPIQPVGGWDENSMRDKPLQPVFKKPKPEINFIDDIISTIFKEIPPKGKCKQQAVLQADAEDDVVLVDAEFEPKTTPIKPKATVRNTISSTSFHPVMSSTPKNFRFNPYRNSPGQPVSSHVRSSGAGVSPFRPTQGNSNTTSRPCPQKSAAFPPYIPLHSQRFRSYNNVPHAQSSHHILPSLKPRVPIPSLQPQPAFDFNSPFRQRNLRSHIPSSHSSSVLKPVIAERRFNQQVRHTRSPSMAPLPHSSARVGFIPSRAQPSTSSTPHPLGSAQKRKVTKLPPPRNIDGAEIVLDDSDTDEPSGSAQADKAHLVPRILSVTSLQADSKYVPNRESSKKQLVNSKAHKDSVKRRPGDVIVLSDSE